MDDDIGQHHRNCHDSEYEGAKKIAPMKHTLHTRVLCMFREHGAMTDEEMLTRYIEQWGPIYKNSLEPRRYELVQQGWIRKSEAKRPGKSGVPRIVWELVPQPSENN